MTLEETLAAIPDEILDTPVEGSAAPVAPEALREPTPQEDAPVDDAPVDGAAPVADAPAADAPTEDAPPPEPAASTTHAQWEAVLRAAPTLATADERTMQAMISAAERIYSGTPAEIIELFEKELAPLVNSARVEMGQVLSPDLQQKVDDGLISEEDAKAWARDRAAAANSTLIASNAAQEAMLTAVQGWAGAKLTTDPDYKDKADLLEDRAIALIRETGKRPATPAEAVALYERAYKDVNERLRRFAPRTAAMRPTAPASTGPRPTRSQTEPKTLEEALLALSL